MAKIELSGFVGEYPVLDPKQMPDNYASESVNVDLRHGRIDAARGLLDLGVPLLSATKTLYLYNKEAGGFWFQFDDEVDLVRAPIANDTELVTYITGGGVPRYTKTDIAQAGPGPYPAATRDLGIPKPATPTAIVPIGLDPPEGATTIQTQYVITYVSGLSEEGPPSDASNVVTRWDGLSVTVSNLSVPTGNFSLVAARIYRVELSDVFQFVAEIPIADTTYVDNVNSELLGAPLATEGWIAPAETMTGLTELPNGVLAGFYGKTAAFCEPFYPHAWPTEYEQVLYDDIVGLAVSAVGVVYCTKGKPAILNGSHPSAYQMETLDLVQPCSSKHSIVDMGSYVMYASPDGLVLVGPGSADLATRNFILPDDFRERFDPSSIHAYRYDDEYLAFYDNGVEQGSFIFNPSRGFRFFDVYCDTAHLDAEDGRLYCKIGTTLQAWDEGSPLTGQWSSKEFLTPGATHFTHGKVDSDNYPIALEIVRDGVATAITVDDDKVFRIASRSRFRVFKVRELTGSGVSRMQFAGSAAEIS